MKKLLGMVAIQALAFGADRAPSEFPKNSVILSTIENKNKQTCCLPLLNLLQSMKNRPYEPTDLDLGHTNLHTPLKSEFSVLYTDDEVQPKHCCSVL